MIIRFEAAGRDDVFVNASPDQLVHDNDPGAIKKRSVILAGHRTSVSLENAFWSELKTIAAMRGMTVNQLVTEIDRQRSGNLSSAIRVFVLQEKQKHTPD